MIFWLGMLIGVFGGFLFASCLVAGEDDIEMVRNDRVDGAKCFAEMLKLRLQKPEHPWEDFTVCESDIDEVLKEMGCD